MEIKTIYKSKDGFEFSSEKECREYEENKIKAEKQKKEMKAVYKKALQYSPENFEKKRVFKIKSKKEYNTIMSVLGADQINGEYEENITCYIIETDYDSYNDKMSVFVEPLIDRISKLQSYIQSYEKILKKED